MLRTLLVGLLLFSSLTNVLAQTTENDYNIIPFPAKFSGGAGRFVLTGTTKILTTGKDPAQTAAAQLLVGQLKTTSGLPISIAPASAALLKTKAIVFDRHTAGRCGPEGYVLRVSPDGVRVEAETPKGYFYAVQTLLQLLPTEVYGTTAAPAANWSMPACDILDRPRFAYRGLMLDVCRHFMPVSFVKKTIDLLALHKMNTFHWHLTDDQGWRIEIKKYPKLTQVGAKRPETIIGHYAENYPQQYDGKPTDGYYTQEQIKDVVRYAAARHVTIVPEIELPGHALAALTAYPELGCEPAKAYALATRWGVFSDVFCPTDKTFGFLQDVLSEVMVLFPGKYIHIGGDECPKDAWKKSAFCQDLIKKLKLKDENELQSYFVRRIEKFVNSKGRAIIGWDEILEGGLAPNATVMSWRGIKGGIEAAKQKHNVIMTPGAFCYLDKYQADPATEPLAIGGYLPIEKVYGYEPVPDELTPAEKPYITGLQGNLWTEYIATPEAVEYMVFPRASALAEVGWVPQGPKNFEDFAARLKTHLRRLDQLKVNYAKRLLDVRAETQFTGEEGGAARQLQVRLSKLDSDSKIYFTTNGKPATTASTEYVAPISLSKTTTIHAITVPGSDKAFAETFYIHRAKGKPYAYATKAAEFTDELRKKLTDGQVATSPRDDRPWVQVGGGNDLELTIDLGEIKPVTKVSATFLKKVLFGVMPPKSVEVSLSKEGDSFKEAIAQPINEPLEGPWRILPVVADFKTARARFVRVTVKNYGTVPAGPGLDRVTGKPAALAIDEVIVE
ncbi:glycoside hydrolase family 20 protein [Fibrella aquatilis]|uniref:beta-N-acetylhexosaminidase n=1 Tax=Fibrella aquatilis TaxID=2817059 RepID=A0A939G2W0_9BACT|nr:family 20 glycosylhydrolase [Fibrella aquatilis]MBO0929445.1 family 20 glycosylhydrolase [Fibrella aquatilis]